MANQKISELTELTTPANEDLLAIVDDPAGTPETKKITVENLLAAGGGGGDVFEKIGISGIDLMAAREKFTIGGSGTEYSANVYDNGLYANANNNATAGVFYAYYNPTFHNGSRFFDREIFVSNLIELAGSSTNTILVSVFGGRNSNTVIQNSGWKMFGIHRSVTTLSAMTDNGSSQTLSTYGSGYTNSRTYLFNHHFTPTVDVKFYRDGVLTNTVTTNLPSGAMTSTCLHRSTVANTGGYVSSNGFVLFMLQINIRYS